MPLASFACILSFIPLLVQMQGCYKSTGDTSSGQVESSSCVGITFPCEEMMDCSGNSTFAATIVHESAPDLWIADFQVTMKHLKCLLKPRTMQPLDIYAWYDTIDPPYEKWQGGQYMSYDHERGTTVLVYEISSWEVQNLHPHRISVIAHEQYHWYQSSVHGPDWHFFSVKWLIEGVAATFESIYLAEYNGDYNFFETDQLSNIPSIPNIDNVDPAAFESYDQVEDNYGYSVYLTLLLAQRWPCLLRVPPLPNSLWSTSSLSDLAEAGCDDAQVH